MLFGLHEAHRPGRILIAPAFGLGLAAGIILIIGGVYLKNREAYLWAVAASVLAMLPWSPAVIIGLPLGLWALLTLRRREVRAAFRHAGVGEEPNARALDEKAPTPAGPVRRKVRSFFGSLRSLIFASRVVHGPVSTQDYQPEPKSEPPSGA